MVSELNIVYHTKTNIYVYLFKHLHSYFFFFVTSVMFWLINVQTHTHTHTIVFRRHDRHRRRCSLLVPITKPNYKKKYTRTRTIYLEFLFYVCIKSPTYGIVVWSCRSSYSCFSIFKETQTVSRLSCLKELRCVVKSKNFVVFFCKFIWDVYSYNFVLNKSGRSVCHVNQC